jgi:hypothetical protein
MKKEPMGSTTITIRIPRDLHEQLLAASAYLDNGNLSGTCKKFLEVAMDDYYLFRNMGAFQLVRLWRELPMLFVRHKLSR